VKQTLEYWGYEDVQILKTILSPYLGE